MNPKAIRSASRRASDGTLAKALSPLAALVWERADGKRSVPDLVELAAAAFSRPVRREDVFLACDELADLGLLQARIAPPAGRAKTTPGKAVVAAAPKHEQDKKAAPGMEEQLEDRRKNDPTVERKEQKRKPPLQKEMHVEQRQKLAPTTERKEQVQKAAPGTDQKKTSRRTTKSKAAR